MRRKMYLSNMLFSQISLVYLFTSDGGVRGAYAIRPYNGCNPKTRSILELSTMDDPQTRSIFGLFAMDNPKTRSILGLSAMDDPKTRSILGLFALESR